MAAAYSKSSGKKKKVKHIHQEKKERPEGGMLTFEESRCKTHIYSLLFLQLFYSSQFLSNDELSGNNSLSDVKNMSDRQTVSF